MGQRHGQTGCFGIAEGAAVATGRGPCAALCARKGAPTDGSPYITSLTVSGGLAVALLLVSRSDSAVTYGQLCGTGGFAVLVLMFLTGIAVVVFFRQRPRIKDSTPWHTTHCAAPGHYGIRSGAVFGGHQLHHHDGRINDGGIDSAADRLVRVHHRRCAGANLPVAAAGHVFPDRPATAQLTTDGVCARVVDGHEAVRRLCLCEASLADCQDRILKSWAVRDCCGCSGTFPARALPGLRQGNPQRDLHDQQHREP